MESFCGLDNRPASAPATPRGRSRSPAAFPEAIEVVETCRDECKELPVGCPWVTEENWHESYDDEQDVCLSGSQSSHESLADVPVVGRGSFSITVSPPHYQQPTDGVAMLRQLGFESMERQYQFGVSADVYADNSPSSERSCTSAMHNTTSSAPMGGEPAMYSTSSAPSMAGFIPPPPPYHAPVPAAPVLMPNTTWRKSWQARERFFSDEWSVDSSVHSASPTSSWCGTPVSHVQHVQRGRSPVSSRHFNQPVYIGQNPSAFHMPSMVLEPPTPLQISRNSSINSAESACSGQSNNRAWVVPLRTISGSRTSDAAELFDDVELHAVNDPRALAFDSVGSRVLQRLLDHSSEDDAVDLALQLQGHVHRAIESPHGNYVIQRILAVLPTSRIAPLLEELSGMAVQVARHRYGCRIINRLIESHLLASGGSKSEVVSRLIVEIMDGLPKLVCHQFGHHVCCCLLEHGSQEHVSLIVAEVRRGLIRIAKHRYGTYTVESAIRHASCTDADKLTRELLISNDLVHMAQTQGGRHVVRSLVLTGPEHKEEIRRQFQSHIAILEASKWGKGIVSELFQIPGKTAAEMP